MSWAHKLVLTSTGVALVLLLVPFFVESPTADMMSRFGMALNAINILLVACLTWKQQNAND